MPDVHVRHPMIIEFSLLDSWLGCWLPMLVGKKKMKQSAVPGLGVSNFSLSLFDSFQVGLHKVPNVVM